MDDDQLAEAISTATDKLNNAGTRLRKGNWEDWAERERVLLPAIAADLCEVAVALLAATSEVSERVEKLASLP